MGFSIGLETRVGERDAESVLYRLAAHTVRRRCNQHDCTAASRMSETCDHPNHRKDVHLTLSMLQMLGLENETVVKTPDELNELLDELRQSDPPPAVDLTSPANGSLHDR